jgi:hypothetical protein
MPKSLTKAKKGPNAGSLNSNGKPKKYIIESASASEIRAAYGITEKDLLRVRKRMAKLGLV